MKVPARVTKLVSVVFSLGDEGHGPILYWSMMKEACEVHQKEQLYIPYQRYTEYELKTYTR
jgi:hypothetical protein